MFKNLFNLFQLQNYIIALSIDEDGAGAQDPQGGEETQEPQGMNLETAKKFVTENGGFVFENEESLTGYVTEKGADFTKSGKQSVYENINSEAKKYFGIDRKDGESLSDMFKRGTESYKNQILAEGNQSDNDEVKAIKALNRQHKQTIADLENSINSMKTNALDSERSSFVSKGLSQAKLNYTGVVLDSVQSGIQSKLNEKFDFVKDDQGWKAIDKTTGNAILNDDGSRKSLDVVSLEFVKSLEGLQFVDEAQAPPATKKSTLPSNNPDSTGLSESQKEVIMDDVKKEARAAGIPVGTKAFFEVAKAKGYPLPKHIKDRFYL